MNLAWFRPGGNSIGDGGLSKESNVGNENDDIFGLLSDLQESLMARKEIFDDGDNSKDEFSKDVNEVDTSNIF